MKAEGRGADLDDTPTIAQRDALKLIAMKNPTTGAPMVFSYRRYTHNRKIGVGGTLIEVPQAVLLTEDALPNPDSIERRRARRAKRTSDAAERRKPGNHFKRATRNFLLPDGSIDKCIIWLLTHINGMRIVP